MKICFMAGNARPCALTGEVVGILRDVGHVSTFDMPVGPTSTNADVLREVIAGGFDRYVYWQAEAFAELLLPLDLGPSILFPSPVAAAARPDAFWRQFVWHRIIAFSRPLHERLQRLRCTTNHFSFFPEPDGEAATMAEAGMLEGVYAPAAPPTLSELDAVADRCRALAITRLIVRAQPPNDPRLSVETRRERHARPTCRLRDLEFRFDARSDPPAGSPATGPVPLFFLAPSDTDGFGIAIARAMGRGQIVVAPDGPLGSDHFSHGVDGLLYGPADKALDGFVPDAAARRRMSKAARRTATNGRRDWLEDVSRLRSLLIDDGGRWSALDRSAHFARDIRAAAYHRIANGG